MGNPKKYRFTRRSFIKKSTINTIGISVFPLSLCSQSLSVNDVLNVQKMASIVKRKFGNFDFEVTTMGVGGQAAIQWTPSGVDPAAIIVKAVKLGINYFDTSNLYGLSQLNYNKAFKALKLIPGQADYDSELRKGIWLTSKTHMRWGKSGWPVLPVVSNTSNGLPEVQSAVDDLKRSLSQIFGDNKGNYPEGAYLDMILIHSVKDIENVDVLYKGLETPLDPNGNFGALVALRDFRDGTNLTGTNPKMEKLVRHIGFSGHTSPPAMIDMIQRDEYGILEALLVSVNANDTTKYSMMNNVIPVAAAKGMGIIAMKIFADAALYHKDARWSYATSDLYLEVGSAELPSNPLIQYSLTTPGVHTALLGIGHIDENPLKCQLTQNFTAAQIEPSGMSEIQRLEIENLAKQKRPDSNYFQNPKEGLTKPRNIRMAGDNLVWDNAFAGDFLISKYEISINEKLVGEVEHKPQTLKSMPFSFKISAKAGDKVSVTTVDQNGTRVAGSLILNVSTHSGAVENPEISLYPNPATTIVNLKGNSLINAEIVVINAAGITVLKRFSTAGSIEIDVSKWKAGLYFIQISKAVNLKFIKT